MKKLMLLALSVILCLQLASCYTAKYPSSSENFSDDFLNGFLEDYQNTDPQLAYRTATKWEVEISVNRPNFDKLRLSLIDNVEKEQFVAATEVKVNFGPLTYEAGVYRHKDAPVPMKDWTIRSVMLVGTEDAALASYSDVEDEKLFREYIEDVIRASSVLKTYDKDNDSEFLNMIKDAYASPITCSDGDKRPVGLSRKSVTDDNNDVHVSYSLIITFEESENIVWYADLNTLNEEELCFNCFSYNPTSDETTYSYGKITAAFSEEIRNLIG